MSSLLNYSISANMSGRGKGGKGGTKRFRKGGEIWASPSSNIIKAPGLFGYAMSHSNSRKHSSKSKRKSTSRRKSAKSKRKSSNSSKSTSFTPIETPRISPISPMSESTEHEEKMAVKQKEHGTLPPITLTNPMSEIHESGSDEVRRMRREFSTLLSKWSEIQQQLVDTLEAPRSTLTTTDAAEPTSPICSPTQFVRHRMTRSATPPPTMRNGELSMHSTAHSVCSSTFRTDRSSMIALSDDDDVDEDAMKVPDAADVEEKERQIEQQRETIEQKCATIDELKEQIASLEKEKHDLVIQNAADKDAVIRETNTAVDRMSSSLAAMQQDMKATSTSDQSVTREHLEKLMTNQLEERKQISEWLSRHDDIATLKQQIEAKDVIIREAKENEAKMAASLAAMQKKLKARTDRQRVTTKQGMLTKVQGQSMEHLRLGRKSRKHVFFAGNRLFWSDATGASGTYKSIEVREVLNNVVVTHEKLRKMNKEAIQKHAQRPWFLVVGQQRCALFEAESRPECDEWVKFIRGALRHSIE